MVSHPVILFSAPCSFEVISTWPQHFKGHFGIIPTKSFNQGWTVTLLFSKPVQNLQVGGILLLMGRDDFIHFHFRKAVLLLLLLLRCANIPDLRVAQPVLNRGLHVILAIYWLMLSPRSGVRTQILKSQWIRSRAL